MTRSTLAMPRCHLRRQIKARQSGSETRSQQPAEITPPLTVGRGQSSHHPGPGPAGALDCPTETVSLMEQFGDLVQIRPHPRSALVLSVHRLAYPAPSPV